MNNKFVQEGVVKSQTFVVRGDSMNPLLHDGDEVTIEPAMGFFVGDIVVAEHPFKRSVKLIKRIVETKPEGYILQGDNPKESTDSRTLGIFTGKMILGKVIL